MSTEPSGFPTLKPAFIIKANIGNIQPFGTIHTGSTSIHCEVSSGTVESVPGFEPAFKAKVNFGADWFTIDHDNKFGRIDIRAIAKTEDGFPIDIRSQGVIEMAPPMAKIFTMDPEMKTTPFGFTTAWATLVVGDPKLKILEGSTFVGNSRMIVGQTGVTVEVRQSLVVPSTVEE